MGGLTTNTGPGFLGSQALWFGQSSSTRMAELRPVDTGAGAVLTFKIRAGNQAVDGALWNNSETGEQVVLEYSPAGSTNWHSWETIDTVYPALTNWTELSFTLPPAALGPDTRIRWRQLRHSGDHFDTWALEDVCLDTQTTQLPDTPPFILASANSATAIAVFWTHADQAESYVVERTTNGVAWHEVITVGSNQNFHTDHGLLPSTYYTYRVKSRNANGDSEPSTPAFARTISHLDDWRIRNFGSADATGSAAPDHVDAAGVPNLIRFAFNLGTTDTALTVARDTGTAGLPLIYYDAANRRLCVKMVRRRAASHPGIRYHVEFADRLGQWVEVSLVQSNADVDGADGVFERVTLEDPVTGETAATRFGRVRVSLEEVEEE